MNSGADQLLTGVLRDVSRSFYQTLRVLPASIRGQIGLAYLLARTTDTIADTELVAPDLRLEALHQLRARLLGESSKPIDFGEFAPLPNEQPQDGNRNHQAIIVLRRRGVDVIHPVVERRRVAVAKGVVAQEMKQRDPRRHQR